MGDSVLARLGPDASAILIRLRSLGDTVLATPAFALLRHALPTAKIHVAMEERFADLLEGQPDIDGVLRIAPRAGITEKTKLLRQIRGLRPDLCIDMHGGSTAAWLTALSGAGCRAGFEHFRHGWAYNVPIPRAQEVLGRAREARVHTAEHHAAAMIHLGAAQGEIPGARLTAKPHREDRPYAVIHAGAAYFTKVWPLDHFVAVATEIRERHSLKPVFVAGPGEEELAGHVPGFEVRRGLSVAGLMSLMAGADLFVGNDSGPSHVAAAFGVPCVTIFGSSDSRAWHPWRSPHRVVETAWECKPCPGDRCYAFDAPRCILSVTTESVSRAIADVLSRRSPPS